MLAREELQKLFCEKISIEMKRYKQRVKKLPPDEIFDSAYQIEMTVSIYELMMEMAGTMSSCTLKKLIVIPNLLNYMYAMWLKQEDSLRYELESCLQEQINSLYGRHGLIEKKDSEVTAV